MERFFVRGFQAIAATALLLPLAGCMVQHQTDANGKENVDISTPLGGMSVKTHSTDIQAKVGLPLYPGAVPEKGNKDDDSTADVNMNFGPFHLRVIALGFTTPDSPEKVRAFYMKPLGEYSDVITCKNKKAVGTPVKTGLGLTCDDDNHVKTNTNLDDKNSMKFDGGEISLKSGSASRQHVVEYEAKNGGTKFGLIYLELPHGDDDDKKGAN